MSITFGKIRNTVLVLISMVLLCGAIAVGSLSNVVMAAPTSAADCPAGDTFVPSGPDNPSAAYCSGSTTCTTNGGTWDGSTCTIITKGNVTCANHPQFLTFPVWYRGLNKGADDCNIASPEEVGGLSVFIWRIASNVIEIGLQAVAYIVAGFILVAGFKLLTTEGNADRAENARNTIVMAAVGFAISVAGIAAINIVSAIFINNP